MTNLDKDIEEVKKLIELSVKQGYYGFKDNVKPFRAYAKTYFSTNENINGYLKLMSKEYSSALTVLSSGDQLFNLINEGINNIDTFDINRIAIYLVFGLKFGMIRKYNYEKYKEVCNTLIDPHIQIDLLTDILNSLLPYMAKKLKIFWQAIINYNYYLQKGQNESISLINMLTQNMKDYKLARRGNKYLYNEKEYLKLKNALDNTKITFTTTDINHLPSGEYDLILLSNIMSYYQKMYGLSLNMDIINDILKRLKYNGIIFFNYIFENEIRKKKNDIDFLLTNGFSSLVVQPISNLHEEDIVILKRKL